MRLVVVPQRNAYLDCEPALVEWRLSNEGAVPVVLPKDLGPFIRRGLEVVKGDHGPATNPPGWYDAGTPARPPVRTLRPGERVTGWFDLNVHARLAPGFDYRFRAALDTRQFKGVDGVWWSSVASGYGDFEVVEGKGEDAKAAALVEAAVVTQKAQRYRGVVFTNTHQRPDLRKQLLEQTRSARFHAAAEFFLGLGEYGDEAQRERYANPGRDELTKAVGHFERCAGSPGASRSMKALATYYAMRCRAEEVMRTPREQTVAAAYHVIDEFPGTCGADLAEKFLATLGAPVRSTPAERFWLAYHGHALATAAALPCLLATYGLYRWRVRAARAARGACTRCGYDLSQPNAPGRCPECGSPSPAVLP